MMFACGIWVGEVLGLSELEVGVCSGLFPRGLLASHLKQDT